MNAATELADLLGPHRVSTDPSDLQRHAHDRSPLALVQSRSGTPPGAPVCVTRPRTTEHVAEILRWAHETRTPVVPYGGGSGVSGAVVAEGAVVVELRAMDEILDFDEKSRLVRVQPGVLGPDLDKALRSWGYLLGHEPQSLRISTVGGWIATKAVGQLSARYGGIEDLVAGLEAVLPGGTIVRSKASPRRSAGPDVASLLIGSEGTLGIVTEATLRVSPLPGERADRCVRFESMREGVRACRLIAQSNLRPTLVRLYDREDSELFLRTLPDEPRGVLLLLSFDGDDASARADKGAVLSGGTRGTDALVAHWWEHRNDAVDDYRVLMQGRGVLGPHALVDTMEVSGTWTVLRDLYHAMKKALESEASIVGCHLSHVYPDGACLYFTLASACTDDEEAATLHARWWEAGMRACLDVGGSISHHHGVGRAKAAWLAEELGGWHETLREVKRAVDPHGIMNPGVLDL